MCEFELKDDDEKLKPYKEELVAKLQSLEISGKAVKKWLSKATDATSKDKVT